MQIGLKTVDIKWSSLSLLTKVVSFFKLLKNLVEMATIHLLYTTSTFFDEVAKF